MYLRHFGLTAQPFQLTPDIGFLFMSEVHSRAKAYMDYTVWNREGFVVVTGEIGCGKTTLLQKLLAELDENVVVAKVFQTQLDEVEFLQAVLVEFGLNPFNAKKVELLDMLNSYIIEQFQQRKQVVLVVDDAHNLNLKALEEIRMLAGLETQKEKVLHVILVGQPQLNESLDHPDMEQLLQRVKLRYHIRALTEKELGEYIRYRLGVAGATNTEIFPPETLPVIYRYTGGIPRLINTLCDAALTCAYADNLPRITVEVIESAVLELQWPPYSERVERRRMRTTRSPEGGVYAMLRHQVETLTTIAQNSSGLEDLSPTLASLRRVLAAIEIHLRTPADKPGNQPQAGSAADRRHKIG
jgi:type II secretory pathway predicted ATPase ExeA